ncbi:MAG: hypothetical protein ACK5Q5_22695, partial [Planctomycetaceae bacterium]
MAFKAILIKNADVILGDIGTIGANFKLQVRSVRLTPNTNVQTIKTVDPQGVFSETDTTEWVLEIAYLDGYDDGEGTAAELLSQFLFDHSGELLPFEMRARSGGRGWSGDVRIIPGGSGGGQGEWGEQTVSLPLDGQPTKLAAV